MSNRLFETAMGALMMGICIFIVCISIDIFQSGSERAAQERERTKTMQMENVLRRRNLGIPDETCKCAKCACKGCCCGNNCLRNGAKENQ